MADPIKVLQSLVAPLASQYAVFERDQVLTHTQLNEVATWLDQQDRLSRVSLVGVGVATGLQLATDGVSVTVSPGVGITTDGDLIHIDEALAFNRVRTYDSSAPRYEPFQDPVTGQIISLELVTDSDPLGGPLPADLNMFAVVLLMETTDSDPDLCTGADCDNLGRERQHRLRVLMASSEDGERLAIGPVTVAERARDLPELQAWRPRMGSDVNNAEALINAYRDASLKTLEGLAGALPLLGQLLPERLQEVFRTDPTGEWVGYLRRHVDASAAQPCFDYFKDVVSTWNELRDCLLDDTSLSMPLPAAFPKHLCIGRIGVPGEGRTGFYPAAADARARQTAASARFLLRRLASLIANYAPPADTTLRVTPSQGEDRPLGERAIPWYYQPGAAAAWNERLSARGMYTHNLGYRAADYKGSPRALAPLAGSIAGHSFFRVEGHLGRPVGDVSTELKKLVADNNLPFEVHAVLAHNRKDRIKIRPGIRYTDLHRFHYLLRQDVSLRLDESDSFSEKYVGSLKAAIDSQDIPEQTDTGISVLGAASSARSAVGILTARAKPALDQQTYSAYRTTTEETRWNNGISETLGSVGTARVNLGKLSRSDFVSPVDSLIQTTHPLWLDWLDDLIQAKDDKADDKLLLSRFATDHPGLDHLGGAWRGGTFILVYDDTGNVIADFTVAYPCAEVNEAEPVEPPLPRPPLRRPPLEIDPIKVIRPVDLVVSTLVGTAVSSRFDTARTELAADLKAVQSDLRSKLETQSANIEGLVKGAFSTKDVTAAVVLPGKTIATGDALLDQMVKDVEYKRQKVQTLVELSSQGDLSDESRSQAKAQLVKAQAELGDSVAETAEHVVTQKVDTSTGAAAGVASVLANSTVYITDSTAASRLGSKLESLKSGTTGTSQTVLIGNLQNLNRLKG